MTTSDWLTILAILLAPIVAIRISSYLEDRKAARNRKIQIYRTLMSTRADNLAVAHVEALNSIDLEFTKNNAKDRRVKDAWKSYLDHLGNTGMSLENWNVKRIDLLVELLHEIGENVGYSFDKVHIKNGIYVPRAHGELQDDQQAIRQGFRELLEGRRSIPVRLTTDPPTT